MVEGVGFEPTKVRPADLQSAPFGRSVTPPEKTEPSILTKNFLIVNRISRILSINKCIKIYVKNQYDIKIAQFLYHYLPQLRLLHTYLATEANISSKAARHILHHQFSALIYRKNAD